MRKGTLPGVCLVIAAACLANATCRRGDDAGRTKVASPRPLGEASYARNCAVCHGAEGRGDGQAAYLLDPKPRDFRRGELRLISTDNLVAADEDILRTIRQGVPGTAMPSWAQLPEAEQRALVAQVRGLRRAELRAAALASGKDREAAEKEAIEGTTPGSVIQPPPPGSYAAADMKTTFTATCAKCHAEDGTGRNDPAWRTGEGFPITSRNFVRGVFKGGRSDLDLYRRIAAGMPGTPMPAFGALPPEYIWKMVRYIESLSDPAAQERAWVKSQVLSARRMAALPADAAAWQGLSPVPIALLQLWARDDAITVVSMRAAYDASDLAIALEWEDATRDASGDSVARFSDGAAVMFPFEKTAPAFTMGEPGRPCHIWHWKALWAADRDGFADVATGRAPAIDRYFQDGKGWVGSPVHDRVYSTGLAAGNSVAEVERGAKGEALRAMQFGTLTAAPPAEQDVGVASTWKDGKWTVIFRHPLRSAHWGEAQPTPGGSLPVALAAWNGSAGDRNGQKSVSIWQTLRLEP